MTKKSCTVLALVAILAMFSVIGCRHVSVTEPVVDIDTRVQITGLDSAIIAESGSIFVKGFKVHITTPKGKALPNCPAVLKVVSGAGEVVVLTELSDNKGNLDALFFTLLPDSVVRTVITVTAGNGTAEHSLTIRPLPAPAWLETVIGAQTIEPNGRLKIPLELRVLGADSNGLAKQKVVIAADSGIVVKQAGRTDSKGLTTGYAIIDSSDKREIKLTFTVETTRLDIPEDNPAFPLMNLLPRDQQVWQVMDFFIDKKAPSTLQQSYTIQLKDGKAEVINSSR